MTYLGALVVVISAFFIGVSKAREEKNRVRTLRDLISALDILKNEICTNKTPIGKILSMDCMLTFKTLNSFFKALETEFSDLGDKRFSNIWSECINNTLMLLPDKSKNELLVLGNNLGRYDSELQKEAIERCIRVLQSECEELERGLNNNEKMYIGLYGGAGLVLALVLI